MSRILITGSADGLGQLAAQALIAQGHKVVLHARSKERGREALEKLPGAEAVVTADLGSIEETKQLAGRISSLGRFDAVIHNAGLYRSPAQDLLAVNTLAPYILTCLLQRPQRHIYLSSGMHKSGSFKPEGFQTNIDRVTYADTKLHVLMLCKALARHWSGVYANAVNPGWVPTKMGGKGAPDDLEKGYETQVWLAVSNDEKARVSGRYFFHQNETRYNPEADDVHMQDRLLSICEEITGVSFPFT